MKPIAQTKLGEVAQFLRGINFKPEDVVAVGTDGTVACMRTKNIQAVLDCADVWGVAKNFVRRPDQILKKGDILVSSANSWNLVGKCCWIPDLPWPATFGGFVATLRANPAKLAPRYLYWWFSTEKTQALLRSFGQKTTNISNLNITRCLNLSVPMFTLPEQRRIAAILDQADALRVKRRETLAQLDSLTQAIFNEMFGDPASVFGQWPFVSLEEVTNISTGYAFRSEEYTNDFGSIKLCRGANVLPGRLDWQDLACWPHSKVGAVTGFHLIAGDVVIAMDRPWISEGFKIAQVKLEDCPALLVQRVARIRSKNSNSNDYIYHLLNHGAFTRHCRPTETTVPHISPKDIRSFQFRLPPKAHQDKFVSRIKTINHLKTMQQASLTQLDTLFASLQHRAFRGEL